MSAFRDAVYTFALYSICWWKASASIHVLMELFMLYRLENQYYIGRDVLDRYTYRDYEIDIVIAHYAGIQTMYFHKERYCKTLE